MVNDSKQKAEPAAQGFKAGKRKKGSAEYPKLPQPTKPNRRITISEEEFPEEQGSNQADSVITIYDFDDEADPPRVKTTIKSEAELKVSVAKEPDLWYRRIKNHVQEWKGYVDEVHQVSDTLKQNLQNAQADAQRYQAEQEKTMARKEHYKETAEKLKDQVKTLQAENLKLKQKEQPADSGSEDDDSGSDSDVKGKLKKTSKKASELKEKPPKRSPEFPKPPTLTDGKDPLYEDWKVQAQDKLRANKDWWPDKEEQARLIIIWTGGMANKHLNARRRYDSEAFLRPRDVFETLDEILKDPNRARNARVKYNDLFMNFKESFAEFYAEFILLANQLTNCSEQTRMKDLKDKISDTLSRATANSGPFTSLRQYKEHLQATDEKLRNPRRAPKASDRRVNLRDSKPTSRSIARTTESLMRVLPKPVKSFTNLQKQVMTNVVNELSC